MLVPVVLSGGAGTRLWPVSRESRPKPFIRLRDGKTLLERTYQRALRCHDVAEIVTVTNRDYYFQTRDSWTTARSGTETEARFLLEPAGRNTAPAILLAALDIQQRHGDDAVLLVLPADHLIKDTTAFINDVAAAATLADSGRLVTFGIPPQHAETGFGYLRAGDVLQDGYTVEQFIEKPTPERAGELIDAGDCYWNAGMFCFRVNAIINAYEQLLPDMTAQAAQCLDASGNGAGVPYLELPADEFAAMEDISIDYGIMEKAADTALVPAHFDWSDIGSWRALAELVEPDEQANRSTGEVVNVDSRNCFIQSEDRVVATIGLDDIMVVDTPDALLVSRNDRVQDVRQVVKQLKQDGHESYRWHQTVMRPWGSFTVLEEAEGYKIKRIEVKPGATLSLQMHHHRSEHWVVVSGTAKVVNGDNEYLLQANESTYIPVGNRHRLENPGIIQLVLIEVQSGEYLGEDDIVRFQDQYGRA